MRSVALAGLTFATLLFSGCANGDSTSTSGQQQNDQDAYPQVNSSVDWTKDERSQPHDMYPEYNGGTDDMYPEYNGTGTP